MRFEDIDWDNWQAQLDGTLLFIVRDGHILLIRAKRGIGKGKINGPGGKVDPGESILDAAVREVEEEVRVTPIAPEKVGEVLFQVTDGTAMRIHVFKSGDLRGTPSETPEAEPLWFPLDDLPFDRMWASDHLWYPRMLAGGPFVMRTLFDGDEMLGCQLV